MDDKPFEAIMEEITMGLTGESEHDTKYLMEQMETHKEHPQGKEIARACGRLLWDALPEEKRQELGQLIDNHGSGSRAVIDEATFNMQKGD